MIAALVHQGFVRHHKSRNELFAGLDLLDENTGAPLCSPYLASVRLMPKFPEECALYTHVEERFGDWAVILLRYYVYALNLRLRPKLAFLASTPSNKSESLDTQLLLWMSN
jgi:hypothetical protein